MQRKYKYILPYIIFLLSLFQFQQVSGTKRILYINSYNSSFPTCADQIAGIRKVLTPQNVIVDLEFMDAKRFNTPENESHFLELLSYKIAHSARYDGVIVSDDNAFRFVLKHQYTLFNGLPIVFFGVNDSQLAMSQEHNAYVTGVIETVSMSPTLQMMTHLFPKTRKIIAISDATLGGSADLKTYLSCAPYLPQTKLDYFSLSNHSFTALADYLDRLPPTQPILLISAYQDGGGHVNSFEQSLSIIHRHARGPVFHLWTHGLGKGVFGGKMTSLFEQGERAAKMMKQVLFDRKHTSDIDIDRNDSSKYIFDNNELARFGVKTSDLPKDCTIINLPISSFNLTAKEMLLIGIIFVLLLVIIVGLSVVSLRKERMLRTIEAASKEVHKLNGELKATTQIAEDNNRMKTAFIHNISHEIRTPMNGILGFSDLLAESTDCTPEERNSYRDTIHSCTHQLLHIVDQMLEISELETNKGTAEENPVCLNEVLRDIYSLQYDIAEKKSLKLNLYMGLTDDESTVITDLEKLQKIMHCLIENAIKFTQKGFVNYGYTCEGELLKLFVKDSGVGIAPERFESIFKSFGEQDSVLKKDLEGIGLSLSIAREYAHLMGGNITVESVLGEGATFTLTLPLKKAETE